MTSSATMFVSAAVLYRPKPNRTAVKANSFGIPIAVHTCDALTASESHAEPEETATFLSPVKSD